ncbi:ABC transporter substrate-binding protein [Neolewinella lacunae]|uniref:Amino acid ABC transporter substrate-binding protein n=1 Tax=Neolewinella lacunae TaxID=1517758 RepID=A0A923PEZ0_9BACT|nr:ABC transporter substrate-binding protein [Neolewinella lacunae]MBC6992888.1 amino acid ABC transporter substrate-binding protein [Neolewinella lacunae]MDN3633748.1 ABC transporter substrate-binding protein [Neolewinella lacunae]
MTSVPNHRPPLSGNKPGAFLFWVLVLALSYSCEALKPAVSPTKDPVRTDDRASGNDGQELDPIQSRRVYDPETGTYIYVENAPTDRMDTVQWTTVSETRTPPIVEDGSSVYVPPPGTNPTTPGGSNGANPVAQVGTSPSGSRLLSAYNVEFALPFLTNRYLGSEDRIDPNSLWALHFYSGARMALDELRAQGNGTNYNVTVQDTKASPERTKDLAKTNEFRQAQLVIGPYLRDNVAALAEAVRGMETVLISPYSAAPDISQDNPNYVQVNPTLETHLRTLLQHAYQTQNADRIVLVTSGDAAQASRLAYLQDEYKILTNNAQVKPLEEIVVKMNNPNATLSPYLNGRKTVFIVPIYEDESFVANFLRLLYSNSRDDFGNGVAVYGLPQWMDYTRINFDYYEGNNVHVSASVFIDKLDPAVRAFRKNFFERFAALPRDEAYVGYDVTRYFLRMAAQHGTRFQHELERSPEDLLHTRFRFEPVARVPANATNFEEATLDHFENKFVNILRFKDYAFKRVN